MKKIGKVRQFGQVTIKYFVLPTFSSDWKVRCKIVECPDVEPFVLTILRSEVMVVTNGKARPMNCWRLLCEYELRKALIKNNILAKGVIWEKGGVG